MTDISKYKSKSSKRTNFVLLKYALVFIVVFSSPYGVIASENVNFSPPQEDQNIIYVAPGAIIYGMEHITVTTSVVILEARPDTATAEESSSSVATSLISPVSISKEGTKKLHKVLGTSKEFVGDAETKDESLQRLQEDVQNRILKTIYTKDDVNPSARLYHYRREIAVVSSSGSSPTFAYVLNLQEGFSNKFVFKNVKQKFYTTVPSLQCGTISATFLRGPPTNVV